MFKKIVLCLILVICLTGCSVQPSKIGKGQAKGMSTKLTYFEDKRTGLCFATIASRKSGHKSQSGLGLTYVPCENLKNVDVH